MVKKVTVCLKNFLKSDIASELIIPQILYGFMEFQKIVHLIFRIYENTNGCKNSTGKCPTDFFNCGNRYSSLGHTFPLGTKRYFNLPHHSMVFRYGYNSKKFQLSERADYRS